ncbi:stage III sporulation protein AF [Pseudalkalibacillus berkeleyi]|uniref:Stage III sporulation protein AF n=1 Tax=Pseudalkalibacillus berkeleyi TaxID=1069813 RepID=A0ABS9H209_9BACL|nr:stage III sporulation protein AF [Pseudalkalibacillus berkeleyi]MCF6137857.1 stage III sporulation protein AF [Pseudalkalibacillus berkeleyi]
MSFLYEWITNIILIILLATILELILPSSGFQKYVKVVIGLLLIIAILNPLIKLFSVDLNDRLASFQVESSLIGDDQVKSLLENKKSEIQASIDAYSLEQMAVLLKQKVEVQFEEQFEKRLKDVVVEDQSKVGSDESHWVVYVTLESTESDHSISVVKEVTIDTSDSERLEEDSVHLNEIEQFLAKHWELPVDQIVIQGEGGS